MYEFSKANSVVNREKIRQTWWRFWRKPHCRVWLRMVSDVVLSLEEAVVAQGEEATVSDMTHAQSRTNAMCGSYYRNFITVEL